MSWRDAGPPIGSPHRLDGGHAVHRSCAVVGSSSSLLRAQNGPAIDSADFIIRVNNAPLPRRFVPHLGRRTSLTIRTFGDTFPHPTLASMRSHAPISHEATEDHGAPTLFYCHVPYLSRCWVWTTGRPSARQPAINGPSPLQPCPMLRASHPLSRHPTQHSDQAKPRPCVPLCVVLRSAPCVPLCVVLRSAHATRTTVESGARSPRAPPPRVCRRGAPADWHDKMAVDWRDGRRVCTPCVCECTRLWLRRLELQRERRARARRSHRGRSFGRVCPLLSHRPRRPARTRACDAGKRLRDHAALSESESLVARLGARGPVAEGCHS